MKIGVLSDTHGWLDNQVFHYFEHCDEIWHAGDIGRLAILEQLAAFTCLRAVYGNIDDPAIRTSCPKEQRFVCAGLHIWITHIGGKPPQYTPYIRTTLQQHVPDLFICGHSHSLCIMHDPHYPPLLYLNPGAAGRYGFHTVRTLVRFEITDQRIHNMEVIELPKTP